MIHAVLLRFQICLHLRFSAKSVFPKFQSSQKNGFFQVWPIGGRNRRRRRKTPTWPTRGTLHWWKVYVDAKKTCVGDNCRPLLFSKYFSPWLPTLANGTYSLELVWQIWIQLKLLVEQMNFLKGKMLSIKQMKWISNPAIFHIAL